MSSLLTASPGRKLSLRPTYRSTVQSQSLALVLSLSTKGAARTVGRHSYAFFPEQLHDARSVPPHPTRRGVRYVEEALRASIRTSIALLAALVLQIDTRLHSICTEAAGMPP
jgi:hypothetical protein